MITGSLHPNVLYREESVFEKARHLSDVKKEDQVFIAKFVFIILKLFINTQLARKILEVKI